MILREVKDFLRENTGYLKKGDYVIAKRLNVTPALANKAKKSIKEELNPNNGPNILVLDVEISPLKTYVFGLWNQNISLDAIESDFFMISWAAKWLHRDNVFGDYLTSEEALEENDIRIIKTLRKVLEIADIVIMHNGDRYDQKKINGRFVEHNLLPVSPYRTIDTLKVVKKQFGFSSNKLEALARKFGFEGKHRTGFKLWVQCIKGDSNALLKMFEYNIQDVIILEEIYYRLLPWITNHPNLNLYNVTLDLNCPNCNSDDLVEAGFSTTSVSKFKSYKCNSCGTISRERKSIIDPSQNKSILTQVE